MMTAELLDQIIERLPKLRAQGVTHFSVDPATGTVSMLIAPLPSLAAEPEERKGPPPVLSDGGMGVPAGMPMPPSFRERMTMRSHAPETK